MSDAPERIWTTPSGIGSVNFRAAPCDVPYLRDQDGDLPGRMARALKAELSAVPPMTFAEARQQMERRQAARDLLAAYDALREKGGV